MDSACLLTRPGASGPAGLPGRYDACAPPRQPWPRRSAPRLPGAIHAGLQPVKWHLAHTTWFSRPSC